MTAQCARTKKAEGIKPGDVCLSLLLFFCLSLMLRRADVATEYMRQGLRLCAHAILPSLFPFMVISELLVATGAGEWILAPLACPLGRILDLSKTSASAVILGLLCGFPIGARCAILSYKNGKADKNECERAVACSSIPSAAFLISTVGATLWGDTKFGVLLYISAILSALLSGILLYGLKKRRKSEPSRPTQTTPAKIHFDAKMFPTAIRNATKNTLLICAYVTFFATLSGTVDMVFEGLAANKTIHAMLSSLLEISGGTSAAAKLPDERFAKILTGAAVGWSGLSVHCQMLSLCDEQDISLRPYLVAKLIQTAACAAIISLLK